MCADKALSNIQWAEIVYISIEHVHGILTSISIQFPVRKCPMHKKITDILSSEGTVNF